MSIVIGEAVIVVGADASSVEKDVDKKVRAGMTRSGKSSGDAFNKGFLSSLSAGLTQFSKSFTAGMNSISTDAYRKQLKEADKNLTKVSSTAAKTFAVLGGTSSAVAGIGAVTQAAVVLGSTLATAAGAALPLPAVLAGTVAVAGTVKIGVMGVADAFTAAGKGGEELSEALKDLSPNAAAFVTSTLSLKSAWAGVRDEIQDNLFEGLGAQVKTLAAGYLPMMRTRLGDIAEGLNLGARSLASWATQQPVMSTIDTTLKYIHQSTLNLVPALTAAADGLVTLVGAGAKYLPDMALRLGQVVTRMSELAQEAVASGAFDRWVTNGTQALGTLAEVGFSVVNIIRGILTPFAQGTGGMEAFAAGLHEIAYEIQQPAFQTGLTQFFTGFAAGSAAVRAALPSVLEALRQLAPTFQALVTAGGVAFGATLTTIASAAIAAAPTLNFISQALLPMAPLLGAIVPYLYLTAKAIAVVQLATAAWTAVQKINTAVIAAGGLANYLSQLKLVQLATTLWTGAQWLLNAALNANPIGIVIVAVAALAAGIVLLWQNSETFRNIVLSAWAAVQSAIGTVAGWITGTVVPGIVAGWTAVAAGAQWLWGQIVGAWNAISAAAMALWADITSVWNSIMGALQVVGDWIATTFGPAFNTLKGIVEFAFKAMEILILAWYKLVVKPMFDAAVAALQWLGDKFMWLYNGAVKIAWDLIVAIIKNNWAAIKAIWDGIVTAAQWLGDKFLWLYNNAVKPAWDWILSIIQANWKAIQIIWSAIQTAIGVLGDYYTLLYTKYVKPAWDFIGDVIKTVWNTIVQPLFEKFKDGVSKVGDAFSKAKDMIGTSWKAIEGLTKAPIRFVIETVLNNGLIKGFNWLSEKVGGPHIDNIPLPFAQGGVLPGYTPGRDVHRFYSRSGGTLDLSGGEAVMRPEFTRQVGGKKGVERLNRLARSNRLSGQFAAGGVYHAMAGGGVVDWIKGQAAGAFDWVGDKASAVWNAFQNPLSYLKGLMPEIPGGKVVAQYATSAANKVLTSVVDKVKSLFTDFKKAFDESGNSTISGGWEAQWAALKAAFPNAQLFSSYRPNAITSSGNQSYHALGRAIDVTPSMDIFNWIKKKYFQNIKELIFTPAGGAQVKNGANYLYTGQVAADHYDHVHWAMRDGGVLGRPLLMDSGGTLPPGRSVVQNNTGGPEALYPASALDVTIQLSIDDLAKLKTLDDFLKMLENARSTARKTQRSGRTAS